jgi:hypothetical protein
MCAQTVRSARRDASVRAADVEEQFGQKRLIVSAQTVNRVFNISQTLDVNARGKREKVGPKGTVIIKNLLPL